MSIKEISASVGYRRTSQFDRRFRAATGITPSSYRTQVFDRGESWAVGHDEALRDW